MPKIKKKPEKKKAPAKKAKKIRRKMKYSEFGLFMKWLRPCLMTQDPNLGLILLGCKVSKVKIVDDEKSRKVVESITVEVITGPVPDEPRPWLHPIIGWDAFLEIGEAV